MAKIVGYVELDPEQVQKKKAEAEQRQLRKEWREANRPFRNLGVLVQNRKNR